MTDGTGLALAVMHTAANRHESQVAVELVDRIPSLPQKNGRRRQRPKTLLGDRAYDAEAKIRQPLRERGVQPLVAKRNTEQDSGLGRFRYVVEACFDWLFLWRRLRLRYAKRDDIHDAFLSIACAMICFNRLKSQGGFC